MAQHTSSSFFSRLFLFLSIVSCATETAELVKKPGKAQDESPPTAVAKTGEKKAGIPLVYSVEFYRDEVRKQAPITGINENNTLTVRFDLLEDQARTFLVRARHLNPDGTMSGLQVGEFMKGIPEDQLLPQRNSSVGAPIYFSYAYRFPNDLFSFIHSGAYNLEIVDFITGETVQELPFFVFEKSLESELTFESFPGRGDTRDIAVQPFLTVTSSLGTKFPCQDITTVFVQDRNWNSARSNGICDQSAMNTLRFYVPREKAFKGNFEYRFLDMSTYRTPNARILEFVDSPETPRVRLSVDNPEFTGSTSPDYFPLEGAQRLGTDARYTYTTFRIQAGIILQPTDEVFLLGAFNRFRPNATDKMVYNPQSGEFQLERLLKEGRYQYSYGIRKPESADISFVSTPFTSKNHEYTALVYLKDINRPAYRLLGFGSGQF